MRHFFIILLHLAAACSLAYAEDRPNVLVFLSDDQGWGDLSISGNPDISTPNIDSLARDGVSFSQFYVSPVCSPTRAEFLTGRHHVRSGVYSTSRGGERMNADELTIADLFKKAGYATGAFGKWHNGTQAPYHPNSRGFDEFYGFCSGHWGNYFNPMLEHNGRIVKGEGFCIDDFTNKAMAFIEKSVNEKKPFFAYLPYNTPHSPMQVPDEFWERFEKRDMKFDGKVDNHYRCALAMCENLDWNVGRMLKHLNDLGVGDNTIIVWFHDNGPNGHRWNGGMRGIKGSTDEGGVRSPLFIRWSNRAFRHGVEIDKVCSTLDLLPTLCELADVDTKAVKLDGMSLYPLFNPAADEGWPDRIVINRWGKQISARNQNFRLDRQGRLYDMHNDMGQTTPVNDKHPELVAKFDKAIADHLKELPFISGANDHRTFPVGHPSLSITQLPARDAEPHGELKRSSRHPNCSYLTNWKTTDDFITFDVDVITAGRYEAVIHYGAKNAGAVMELSAKKSTTTFKVDPAHDVPEQGAEHDRHPRTESYVKDFNTLNAGTLVLEKGANTITLKALKIPGGEAMEFRLLTLELKP